MENIASSKLIKKHPIKLESSKQGKMLRKLYIQFLEMFSRKTDAEKRVKRYGKDPFK